MQFKRILTLLACTGCVVYQSYSQSATSLVVSPQHPVKNSDTSLRNELVQWSQGYMTPNKVYDIHPSSVNFPGSTKPGYELKIVSFPFIHKQTDTAQYQQSKKFIYAQPVIGTIYSTGLYAVAGQPFYVTFPPSLIGREIYLLIGAHLDFLDMWAAKNENWRRMPGVTSVFSLDSALHFATSPFGGLIYLWMPQEAPSVDVEITFKDVITAPYYKLGVTSVADWKNQLADNKAPWGEIASDKIILTLPDSALQKIEDPGRVLKVWNRIVTTEAELAQLPSPYIRPFRMVVDEHMAAGAMHSGYPIMIHHSPSAGMLSLDVLINPEKLLQPSKGGANWGFFHEIGHNLQNHEWVFDGTTEVGCNFYALYVFDQLLKTREGAHSNIKDSFQMKLMKDYFAKGASYEDYKKDPFLGLIPFMQLQKQFGWKAFKKVFKWYLDHPSGDFDMNFEGDSTYQKMNQHKISRFVERFSIATKRNLAPFFQTWGLPVDKELAERVKKYKTWLPEELKQFKVE